MVLSGSRFLRLTRVAEDGVWPVFCGWEPRMAPPSALRGRRTVGLVLVLCVKWQLTFELLMCARPCSVLYMLNFTLKTTL